MDLILNYIDILESRNQTLLSFETIEKIEVSY